MTLRHDLAGWTRDAIASHLGERALAALDRDIAVPARIAAGHSSQPPDCNAQTVGHSSQTALLTRLLWLGDSLTEQELALALPATFQSQGAQNSGRLPFLCPADGGADRNGKGLVSTGQLAPTTDRWRSRWQVVPVDIPQHLRPIIAEANPDSLAARTNTVWIASSHGALQGARHGENFVMGVGGASRTLAQLASYQPGTRVLDLGTGSGFHAILAALCGASATATDVSEAALQLAEFNALLNGVRLDIRSGSLFDPVRAERFDTVVSNPPFVITPPSARDGVGRLNYRDGGLEGDQLSEHVVRALAEHLYDDGRAWMLLNWEIPTGAEESDGGGDPYLPLRQWAAPNLDLHVIMRERLPVTSYIETWLADGGLRLGHPDYERSYAAWLADFDKRGITEIGLGYISAGPACTQAQPTSGRAPVAPLFLGQHLRGTPPANLHEYTEAIWHQRHLGSAEVLTLAPIASNLVEHRFYHPGEPDPWIIKFTQTNGFGEEMLATTELAGFVSVADGELTTAQITAALAEILHSDPADLAGQLLPKVVEMKRLGMLTFDDPPCE
ncbi:SAM-dependent methyltransferase [Trueperella bonasi]|uniref:SAM-dependent methyltransferase n=1 Tax=Trueperella bonasi TaxID=312286 RepID=A0ABT9NFR7_9ACTO|nr:methyltransferase [Trueperella bonasi]MDP9806237.1 SAM-dependent methyltransferase [Trueperella bonasi]